MPGKLICFIGTDGSGKSTAAKRMKASLEKSHIKCCYIWGAYDLRFFRFIIKTAKKLLMKNDSPYGNYKEYKDDMRKASNNKLLVHAYKLLVFTEYWFQSFFKIKIYSLLGYVVLCDRYVYDVIINMAANLDLDETTFTGMLKRWLRFFPSPDLIIFFSVPPEVSISRKKDIPDIEYVRKRFYYYEMAARNQSIKIMDGTMPPKMIEEKVFVFYASIGKLKK